MATQKYRYGKLVVEVERLRDIGPQKAHFRVMVRGFGTGSKSTLRKQFMLDAKTNAEASRLGLAKYQATYGKEETKQA